MQAVLDFFFNGTDHEDWQPPTSNAKKENMGRRLTKEEKGEGVNTKGQNGRGDGHGGHGTSQDPVLRARLVEAIKEVDKEHFNGDVAWLKAILRC